ncbi:hypothetical protein [Streptomyces collinus]
MSFADAVENVNAHEALAAEASWPDDMALTNLDGLRALEEKLRAGARIRDDLRRWAGEAGYERVSARLGTACQTLAGQAVMFLAACTEQFHTHVDEGIHAHVRGLPEEDDLPVMRAHIRLITEQKALGEELVLHFRMLETSDLLGHAAPRLAQVRERFDYTMALLDEHHYGGREELARLGHVGA